MKSQHKIIVKYSKMKTKLFTLLVLMFVSLTAFTQNNQRSKVAVYMTGPNSGINKVLGDQLVAAFSQSNKYVAIERTASFLAELSKEQRYQRTGAVSDNEISRLGKQFGVQLVCVVDISDVFGQKYVSARLIDVENAEVVNTANTNSSLNSMDELMRVSDSLKGQLFSEMADSSEQRKAPQGYVDLGLSSGVFWSKRSIPGNFTYNEAEEICAQHDAKIPSLIYWTELFNECEWKLVSGGFEVKGKNGATIFLNLSPAWTSRCEFWTSQKYREVSKYYKRGYYTIIIYVDGKSRGGSRLEGYGDTKSTHASIALVKTE